MKFSFVVACCSIVTSCYQVKSGNMESAPASFLSLSRQALVATVKPEEYPWSASVYSVDLEQNQEPELILSGESSDPVLFQIDQQTVILFNRSSDNQNYRMFSLKNGVWSVSGQIPLDQMSPGDPHDVVLLGEGKVLLANYVAGNLAILDIANRTYFEVETVAWGLPVGSQFHPESILRRDDDVWVVHQGYGSSAQGVIADGSQAAFKLHWNGEKLLSVDLDESTPEIDGVKLAGSFPVASAAGDLETFPLWSLCGQYIDALSKSAGKECHQSVDALNVISSTSTEVWDLSSLGLYMNGTARAGINEKQLFASVEVATESKFAQGRYIVQLNLEDQTAGLVYQYEETSGGFWAFWFDAEADELIAGDSTESQEGKLTILNDQNIKDTIMLPEVPYAGVLLRGTHGQ